MRWRPSLFAVLVLWSASAVCVGLWLPPVSAARDGRPRTWWGRNGLEGVGRAATGLALASAVGASALCGFGGSGRPHPR